MSSAAHTVPLCGYCGRPAISPVVIYAGQVFHDECTRGPSVAREAKPFEVLREVINIPKGFALKMTDDLVERLRSLGDHAAFEPHMHHVAADEITRLRAEVRELHMKGLADLGQAQDAWEAKIKAEADLAAMTRERDEAFNAGIEAALAAHGGQSA